MCGLFASTTDVTKDPKFSAFFNPHLYKIFLRSRHVKATAQEFNKLPLKADLNF